MIKARIDHIVGGIYRMSVWSPDAGLTFNQFLIDDEAPTLVHTGRYEDYEAVVAAVSQVLDPARLVNLVLLHWEGDENGGMERFMSHASRSRLVDQRPVDEGSTARQPQESSRAGRLRPSVGQASTPRPRRSCQQPQARRHRAR